MPALPRRVSAAALFLTGLCCGSLARAQSLPSPVVASGLRAWYRADLGVTRDASSNVSLWADVSGNGYDLVQAVTGRQPTWVGSAMYGQPALQFSGTAFLKTATAVDEQAGSNDVTAVSYTHLTLPTICSV